MDPDLRRKLLLSTGGGGGGGAPTASAPTASAPSSPLCPLPEHDEISIPIPGSSPTPSSSLKDILIFGPFPPDPTEALTPPCSPAACADPPPYDDPPWNSKSNLHRSRTAPALSAINEVLASCPNPNRPPSRPSVVRQAFLLLTLYLLLGVAVYNLLPSHFFSAAATLPVVDALYFCIVTMCTIGYGDITPTSPASKLFSIAFVLLGFGFVDILLSAMVSYVLDLQESLLLATARNSRAQSKHGASYIVDLKKGRMRIRLKVGLALGVVVLCIGVGVAFLRFVENLDWLDSFYLSVMSVTTVGYGDQAFKTLAGRLFASVWLLVSTLAVARAFLYLAEARVDKRHRELAKWVLSRDMTVAEFLAADIDNNGFVSKSEFVVYKLKEMGKIAEKDICQICDQFDRLDTGNCGKITLSDLLESHQQ